MLARETIYSESNDDKIEALNKKVEELEYENRMLELRVSELEKHVFTF